MEKGRGLVVWYKSKEGGNNLLKAKLHFNFWRIPRPNIFEYLLSALPWSENYPKLDFLDVGIWLEGSEKIENLSIYIPYEINISNVKDLGYLFKKPDIGSNISVCKD